MIQSTSLEIYLKEVCPNLRARQRPVLHHLRTAGGAYTNAEIAGALARPINEITPRCLELRRLGLVLESGAAGVDYGDLPPPKPTPTTTSTADAVCYTDTPDYQLDSWNVTLHDCQTGLPLFPVQPLQ
jgi:hypothetical protein